MPGTFQPENRGRDLIARSQLRHEDEKIADMLSLPVQEINSASLHADMAALVLEPANQHVKTAAAETIAPAADKPLMKIGKSETIFQHVSGAELKMAYVTHHDDLKSKLTSKAIEKSAKKNQPAASVTFQNALMTQKNGAPDRAVLRKLLMENDVVMLESNLGINGAGFSYDHDLFQGSRAKVLFFEGGAYPESDETKAVKEQLGDRLLARNAYQHAKLREAFTPAFWKAVQATDE